MSAYNNTITLVGRLGGDPEIQVTPAGKVASFQLAVNRNGREKKETDWFRVEAWKDVARGVEKQLSKGDKVIIFGSFKVQKVDDKKATYYKVIARNIGYDLSIKEETVDIPEDSVS